uniref:Protein phosphatase n=1 Tax=Triticum urartu TaxID=4572 RepID=A0A8R7TSA2_TRIUA
MAASTASRLSPPCLHAAPHHPLRRSRFSPLRAAKLEAVLSIGTHVIPHPRKVETGGEDAFFVGGDGCGVFAIADGVSGWAEKNVNPALFSRELMANSSTFIKDEEVSQDPQILLMKAHAATSSIGSATVIVAMLEKTGTLKIASVGDCGLKVIRKGQVMFSTCPQEHYFDCPYQLSSEAIGQTSQDALVCTVNLMEGDMIVSGSDGFFDNIFDQEILSVINESPGTDEAAKALAELARKHSVDVTFDSPYSMEARSRVRNKYILPVILSLFTSFFNSFAKKCMISHISFRLLTCRVLMFLGGRSYLELS